MNVLMILLSVLISYSTYAAGEVSACAPTIQAEPIRMSCRSGADFVQIKIETLIQKNGLRCPPIEASTAIVSISDPQGLPLKSLRIISGHFEYDLGTTGSDARFYSRRNGLQLKNCVVPEHGGVSFGN